jgi:hypothetical protein
MGALPGKNWSEAMEWVELGVFWLQDSIQEVE